jgi:hypothetical protein
MRFLLSLGAVVLLATAVLSAMPADSAAAGAANGATVTVRDNAAAGRVVDGGSLAPEFFSRIWKKIKRIVEKIIAVIDAIDATLNQGGGGGGGSGKTIGAVDPTNLSPTRPEWPPVSPTPFPTGVV